MHVAFLTSLVMDGHPTTGYEIANQAIVDGLRRLGVRVSVLGFRLPRQQVPTDPDTHVLAVLDLENASVDFKAKVKFAVRAVVHGLPISASKLTVFPEEAVAAALAQVEPVDLKIFNSYQMAAAFPSLFDERSFFLAHNIEHVSAEQNARSATGFLQRFLYKRDARLLAEIEQHLVSTARYTWTLTEEDGETLGVPADRGGVLPLILPTATLRTPPNAPEAPPRDFMTTPTLQPHDSDMAGADIGLIGTWTWEPNRVGLEWFLKRVVGLLPGDFSIQVAGSLPEDMPRPERVTFLGRVPSAASFLKSVRVVPLVAQGGTGVQLKTVEAFQTGLACVATRSSLRGISVLPRNCRQADDPVSFAAALTELIGEARRGKNTRIDGGEFLRGQSAAFHESLVHGLEAVFDMSPAAQLLASGETVYPQVG
ncbi:MAG: glycosyltransferase family 4 protein [Pseudomonadota bacterium]